MRGEWKDFRWFCVKIAALVSTGGAGAVVIWLPSFDLRELLLVLSWVFYASCLACIVFEKSYGSWTSSYFIRPRFAPLKLPMCSPATFLFLSLTGSSLAVGTNAISNSNYPPPAFLSCVYLHLVEHFLAFLLYPAASRAFLHFLADMFEVISPSMLAAVLRRPTCAWLTS